MVLTRSMCVLGLASFLLACASASADTTGASRGAVPRNDRLLVLPTRAGPFRYLDGWKSAALKRTDYPAAVAAFGRPSGDRIEWLPTGWFPESYNPKAAGYCHVTWAAAGITVSFFSWSGWWPPDEDDTTEVRTIDPCAATEVATGVLTGVRLFGAGWRNRTGYQVGAVPPAGRPLSLRQRLKTADGSVEMMLSVSLDDQGRVSALKAKVLSWP